MAARFWNKQNASANWNVTAPTNWGSASGVADGASVPGSSDDVTFDGAGAGGNAASTISASTTILSLTFTAGYTQTVTLNSSQALTVAGNFTDNTAHNWTVNSVSTAALTISATSTITSGGKTWPGNVRFLNTSTKTIVGDWTIGGGLETNTGTTTINKTTAETITCTGFNAAFVVAGNINITINGGTWTGSATNNMTGTITLTGTVTVSGTVNLSGTLVNSGATVTTTGSTLQILASSTLNTTGISWNIVTVFATSTITINSLLTATTLNVLVAVTPTFAGTAGWTVGTFTCSSIQATTLTLVNGLTYTITTAFNAFNSRTGGILLITSDHATNKAILTLNNGATCNVLASFTRIDASAGRPIDTFNGVVTTCNNINVFNDVNFLGCGVMVAAASY